MQLKEGEGKREDPTYLNSSSVLFGSLFGNYILLHQDQGKAIVVSQLQNVFDSLVVKKIIEEQT